MGDFLLKLHVFHILLCSLITLVGCNKGEKLGNEPPETLVVPRSINLSGELRLKSTVQLNWFGSDIDGFVKGYEFSLDQKTWFFTTKNDSTFVFSIADKDTADINFWVRAIDNMGAKDATPAKLVVPIKNTPPNITLNKTLSTSDTAFLVATLFWEGDDPDGIDNLKGFELRINNGNWFDIPKSTNNVSITATDASTKGPTEATIYLTASKKLGTIDGLVVGDTNSIYIRSYDLSRSYSELDTLSGLFFKEKSSDLIVIGGDRDRNAFYLDHIKNIYPNFDYVDYTANNGAGQPTFWNPTFTLMAKQYEKLFIYSDKTTYLNENTQKEALILDAASESLKEYIGNGGKAFIVGYFSNPLDETLTNLYALLSMKSMDEKSKGIFLKPGATSLRSKRNGYPNLGTRTFVESFSPFEKTTDAREIYQVEVDSNSNYSGPKTIGVLKENENTGNTYQVYIGASMADLNFDYSKVDTLFYHVLNVEFNW